jgi:hypothetical protein
METSGELAKKKKKGLGLEPGTSGSHLVILATWEAEIRRNTV